ncbi:MAG: hypothetical protein U0269_25240 [Polyangiales bacterium]
MAGDERWEARASCGAALPIVCDPRAAWLCPESDELWVVEWATPFSVERLRCIQRGVDVPLRKWDETIADIAFSNAAPMRLHYTVRERSGALRNEVRSAHNAKRVRSAGFAPATTAPNALHFHPANNELGANARGPWVALGIEDERSYFARRGSMLALFDSERRSIIAKWEHATALAISPRAIAIARDGHCAILERDRLTASEEIDDFGAARSMFVGDDGTVVAQDAKGIIRWWRSDDGSLLCEHRTPHRLEGLACGGSEAVLVEKRRDEVVALRSLVVRDAIAVEQRAIELSPKAKTLLYFSEDLRDIVLGVERESLVNELQWWRDRALFARATIEPTVATERSQSRRVWLLTAHVMEHSLRWVTESSIVTAERVGDQLVRREQRTLTDELYTLADWGLFSQRRPESHILATLEVDGSQPSTLSLDRRSSERAVVAERAPVFAWKRLDQRSVGVRSSNDAACAVIDCVDREARDTVHSLALSPNGRWLAVGLRSGLILRFERP